ncbi:MAG: hypothetical protein M2R45_01849 [Verrucomicrobia subdivision 3 bacterium]|nr:hypothetical protein [Limisphaerales bacterium]MCS1415649.1 hypothetical protein [Limisphaerales bacterium]
MNAFQITATVLIALLSLSPLTVAQERQIETSAEYHDNVVIVLDASGSMKQRMRSSGINKMNAAKAALKAVLKNVPETTHIGLLVFSANNLEDHWVYPLGPRDESRLIAAIDRPQANHGTPLGEYIKIGTDRLLEARTQQYGYGTYRLLIVTDGDANDPELVDLYTPEVLARGITMDVIGVDMDQDHTLATMAHSYRRANDPDSLKKAIQEVFAELSTDSGDFSMDEAFELIAPLPIECAAAALQALSAAGNQPIGESAWQENGSVNQSSLQNPPRAQTPQSNQTHAPPTVHRTTSIRNLLMIGIVGLIILLVLVKKAG